MYVCLHARTEEEELNATRMSRGHKGRFTVALSRNLRQTEEWKEKITTKD
jgi:hypothetical protein